jgi:Inhibitor of sigma-G Gin
MGGNMMENKSEKCFLCGKYDLKGIIINGERICRECEAKIVESNPSDNKFDEFKDKIKIILYK